MANIQESILWSTIKQKRQEVKGLYPSIFRVPIIYGTKEQILRDVLKKIRGKILDIGAGDRFAGKICTSSGSEIEYKSMDIDNSRCHDFYSIDEIQEKFDAILLLDVIEHLALPEGKTLLLKCSHLLNP